MYRLIEVADDQRLCVLVTQLWLTLCNSRDCSPRSSSVGFPRQEYWSGLPFPSPLDRPSPGIKPGFPLPSDPPGRLKFYKLRMLQSASRRSDKLTLYRARSTIYHCYKMLLA